jgi:hypothetical protein
MISSIEDLPVIVWMPGHLGGDDETGGSWLAIDCTGIDQPWRQSLALETSAIAS